MSELTDEQRLAVLRELYDLQERGLAWASLYVVVQSYEQQVRERLRASGQAELLICTELVAD